MATATSWTHATLAGTTRPSSFTVTDAIVTVARAVPRTLTGRMCNRRSVNIGGGGAIEPSRSVWTRVARTVQTGVIVEARAGVVVIARTMSRAGVGAARVAKQYQIIQTE